MISTTVLDACGHCEKETNQNWNCPSLAYRKVNVDGYAPYCEALAKASNFLWELVLGGEFSDPDRFGYNADEDIPW